MQAEFLEAQHHLREALHAIERARGTARGEVKSAARVLAVAAVVHRGVIGGAGQAAFEGALGHMDRADVGVGAKDKIRPGRRIARRRAVIDEGRGETQASQGEEN